MGRRFVGVLVKFLVFLSMFACVVSEPEKSFLEYSFLAVPEADGEAKVLEIVRYTGDAVVPPSVCPEVGMFEGEMSPCIAPRTMIFSDSSPLSLADVWSPLFKRNVFPRIFRKTPLFSIHGIKITNV